MVKTTIVVLGVLLMAGLVSAQGTSTAGRASVLDIEAGGGYLFGGGAENPGPSLPTYDLGVVVWPVTHWGFAVRFVRGPGHDFYEPIVQSDRTFYGPERLSYNTFTVRYRGLIRPKTFIEAGVGVMANGQFSVQQFLYHTQTYIHTRTSFNGYAIEALVSHRFTRHLGMKAGVTIDFNVETNNFQPLVLGTVGF